MEVWKYCTISGKELKVSNLGTVFSISENKVLMGYSNQKGNLSLEFKVNNVGFRKRHCPSIHPIVAKLFLGDRPYGFQINHKDGNKGNNAASNLEYVTCKENILHALNNNLNSRYLSKDTVLSILNEYNSGVGVLDIQRKHSISREAILSIVTGRTYTHFTNQKKRKHFYKLTESDVVNILEMLKEGCKSSKERC